MALEAATTSIDTPVALPPAVATVIGAPAPAVAPDALQVNGSTPTSHTSSSVDVGGMDAGGQPMNGVPTHRLDAEDSASTASSQEMILAAEETDLASPLTTNYSSQPEHSARPPRRLPIRRVIPQEELDRAATHSSVREGQAMTKASRHDMSSTSTTVRAASPTSAAKGQPASPAQTTQEEVFVIA